MMTTRLTRSVMSLSLTAALLSSGVAPAFAAEADEIESRPGTGTTVDNVKGKKLKVAKAKVANNWTRFRDRTGDLVARDGTLVEGAEPWSDLTVVSVVRSGAAVKMLRVLGEDYPRGTAGAYYGVDADWQPLDEAFYVVARTDGKLPRDAESNVQLIVTFDGEEAIPVRAGGLLGPYDGSESFSLSGPFEGGAWASGTTNLAGWELGEDVPFYNGPSEDIGYYDRKNSAFMHVARVPEGATSATVTLRSETDAGEVFDRVELPAGGRFLGLDSPTWGLKVRNEGVPLACRSVETVSAGAPGAESLDPGMNLVRYSAGWQGKAGVAGMLDELGDTITLELTAVGRDDEPTTVDAPLTLDRDGRMLSLELVVPDGQWMVAAPEDGDIETSGGQSLVDLRPLTGSAGLLAGPGHDGLVAGDTNCGVRSASGTGTDAS